MKRDWKLIRAILLEGPTDAWDGDTMHEHLALCAERGWVCASVVRGFCGGVHVIRNDRDFLTPSGLECADALMHIGDLEWALSELNSRCIGHSEELVLSLVKKRAMERLGYQH